MSDSRKRLFGLAAVAGLACPVFAVAQPPRVDARLRPAAATESPQFRTKTPTSALAARAIPMDALNPNLRERVRKVIASPTLVTHAKAEEFTASVAMYQWLMDHPDRAAAAWARMGIPCSPISDRGRGFFGWADEHGSDVVWSTIAQTPQARVWYAEGQVKPGKIGPTVPVRAVVVMRYTLPESGEGTIRHEIDIFCHADSRAAQLAYRMFGPTADRHAEEAAGQLLMFFSVLSKHMREHPDQAERLLAPPTAVRAASK